MTSKEDRFIAGGFLAVLSLVAIYERILAMDF